MNTVKSGCYGCWLKDTTEFESRTVWAVDPVDAALYFLETEHQITSGDLFVRCYTTNQVSMFRPIPKITYNLKEISVTKEIKDSYKL